MKTNVNNIRNNEAPVTIIQGDIHIHVHVNTGTQLPPNSNERSGKILHGRRLLGRLLSWAKMCVAFKIF